MDKYERFGVLVVAFLTFTVDAFFQSFSYEAFASGFILSYLSYFAFSSPTDFYRIYQTPSAGNVRD